MNQREEFEAFVEAAIIFGRAAVHRFKTKHERHPAWKAWWDSLLNDPTMTFFAKSEIGFLSKDRRR